MNIASILLATIVLSAPVAAAQTSSPSRVVTKAASDVRIYLNPGHGGWGGDDRPMESIPYPKNSGGTSTSSFPDTCGFYESNTDLWKMIEARERLIEMGVPDENITLSRWNNGPYPRDGVTYHSGSNFSRTFSVINAEVNAGNYDMFVSLHSNGTGTDHTLSNYELILYRQLYTSAKGKYEATPPSSDMGKVMWGYHYMDELDPHSTLSYSSRTVPYVVGDLQFYGSTSSNGYLGVLKHNPPGFLMEGFFHTYDPAKHRALNEDYCRQEGARVARGIAAWFSIHDLPTGDIMGTVKDKSAAISHSFYNYRSGTDDAYTPVHGAHVSLYKGDTYIGAYTTDDLYNGIFVFEGLTPGSDYYITVKKEGYANLERQGPFTVTAAQTTYPQLYLTAGTATDPDVSDLSLEFVKDYEDHAIDVLQGKTVRRVLQRDDYLVVLAVEDNATHTPHLYRINPSQYVAGADGDEPAVVEISTAGLVSTADNGGTDRYDLSDIAFTTDGYLVGCNALQTQSAADQVASGTRGVLRVYKWASLSGAPSLWFTTATNELSSGHWYRANVGLTMAYNGSSDNGWLMTPAVNAYSTGSDPQIRDIVMHVAGGALVSTYVNYDRDASANRPNQSLTAYGTDVRYSASPVAPDRFVIDGELIAPREIRVNTQDMLAAKSLGSLPTTDVVSRGASAFVHKHHSLLVSPLSSDGSTNAGIVLSDVTSGLRHALTVSATGTGATAAGWTTINATGASLGGTSVTLHLMRDGKLTRWHVGTAAPVNPDPDPTSDYDLEWTRVYDNNTITVLAGKTIRRVVHLQGSHFAVLAVDGSRTPYLYDVDADASTATAISTTGIVDVATENNQGSSLYTLSDIAVTTDGKLIACNQLQTQDTDNDNQIESGKSRGYLRVYRWDDISGAPVQWFTSPEAGFLYKALVGGSIAYTGSSTAGQLVVTAVNDFYSGTRNTEIRYDIYNIAGGSVASHLFNRRAATTVTTTTDVGTDFKLAPSASGAGYFMIDSPVIAPIELKVNDNNLAVSINGVLPTADVMSGDANCAALDAQQLLVAPYSDNTDNLGLRLYDISTSVSDAAVVNASDVTLTASAPAYTTAMAYTAANGDFIAYLVRDNVFAKWVKYSETPLVDEGIGIFAYDLRQSVDSDDAYTFTFKVNTTPLEAALVFSDNAGTELGRYAVASPVKGDNSVTLSQDDLPIDEGITAHWAVYVKGFDITEYARLNTGDGFTASDYEYNRASVAVDNSPESDWFGSVYVNEMATNGAYNSNTANRDNGLYRYNPLWQRENSAPYTGQMAWNNNFRISTDYRGRIYIPEFGDKHSGVYIADPDNLSGTFTQLFAGTRASSGLITNSGVNTGSSASSVFVKGSGADTKLYVTLEDIDNAPGIYEYDLGSLIDGDGNLPSTWTTAPTLVKLNALSSTLKLCYANTNVVATDNGALWVSENLINGSKTLENLPAQVALVNITPARDYWGFSNNYYPELSTCSGGGMAVSLDGTTLYIVSTDDKVLVYTINNTNVEAPTLTLKHTLDVSGVADDATTGGSGRVPHGVYQMAFDYGGNLYVAGGALGIYSVPTTDNSATTPAKQALTVTRYRSRSLGDLVLEAQADVPYKLLGRDLYGAYVLNDGRTVIAHNLVTGEGETGSDDNPGEDVVDYIAERTTLMEDNPDYLHADWIKIVLPRELTVAERSAIIGGSLGNVYGTVTDAVNLTLTATDVPAVEASAEQTPLNVVIPCNFVSNHVGLSGTHYYFYTPQVNEVVTVYWAMWDGEKFTAIPRGTVTATGIANADGLQGEFAIDMSLYSDPTVTASLLETSKAYNGFTALVQQRSGAIGAKRRAPATGSYILYPLDGLQPQDIATAVTQPDSDAPVVSVDYYDVAGRKVNADATGVIIEVSTHSDGAVTTRKVLK